MKRIQIFLILIGQVFLFSCQSTTATNNELKRKIDAIVKPLVESKKHVGIVVGIIHENKTCYLGYGKVSKKNSVPPNEKTIFEIGSVGKTFTASLLSILEQESKVSLDDPISKYLPCKVPVWKEKPITLVNLAMHTSGLPRIPDNLYITMILNQLNPYEKYSVEDMYKYLAVCKLGTEPGTRYEYSNLGMGLLGHIFSLRTGVTYEELVKDKICSKLEMNDTVISLNTEQKPRFATGHSNLGKPVPHWDFTNAFEGAGALRSTAQDLIKFISANISETNPDLSKAFEKCHKPRFKAQEKEETFEIGLGWHISQLEKSKKKVIWHDGATGGFESFIGFVKETKTGVVVLSNTGIHDWSTGEAGMKIFDSMNE